MRKSLAATCLVLIFLTGTGIGLTSWAVAQPPASAADVPTAPQSPVPAPSSAKAPVPAEPTQSKTTEDAIDERELAHARGTVRLLDDVLKPTVVAIHKHYVHTESDLPAASIAKALFAELESKGYEKFRLIDLTGEPIIAKNVAVDDFEKRGAAAIKGGKDSYEEVVREDGVPKLRAMTSLPVVLPNCLMCHPHFEAYGKEKAIGAFVYKIPIK